MPLSASDHALVFDMDGVLIDNTPYQAEAFRLLFRELGLSTDATQLLRRLNGMPASDILRTVYRHPVPEEQLKQYADRREFLYRTLYWEHRRELPGLTAFLEAARAAGFRLALGTGSGPETIGYILDHLNLRRFFEVVTSKADVDHGKPHADTYTAVAEELGLAPAQCVVFEDAILGEQAAYRAGMRCIAVSSTLAAGQFQAPLHVIRDFTDLTPRQVLTLLEQHPQVPQPDRELAKRQYMQL